MKNIHLHHQWKEHQIQIGNDPEEKIKVYKGKCHAIGKPVNAQRT